MNSRCSQFGRHDAVTAPFSQVSCIEATQTVHFSKPVRIQPGYIVKMDPPLPAPFCSKSGNLKSVPPRHGPRTAASIGPIAEQTIEASFIVRDRRGPRELLECPRCGWEFNADALTGENLVLDQPRGRRRAVCPLCGTVGK